MFNFLSVFCCIFDFSSVTQLSIVNHRGVQEQSWSVISMGIRSRLGVEGKTPLRAIANLGATVKRATEILLPTSKESIPLEMLASNCLPYEASKTYRTIMTESDCRRAQTMMEVQRSLRRI
jgi:hypothetical protein